MAVDFPSSPTPGQVYTQAGATWTWDGVKWVAQGTGTGIYLPLAGGVMTGDITLKGDPSAPLHPVTYRMVSNPNDNRIINGDMRIDQRNNGASGTAGAFTVDRWQNAVSTAGKLTWGRNLNSVSSAQGFPYYLGYQSTSAYTVPAGEIYALIQNIEADMVSDFWFGTASAQPITLSFWAQSSKTGTFSGSIGNYVATRSYPFTYSIPTANTWTKIVVTIPGDTGGTWQLAGSSGCATVGFDLGSGATYRGAAGAWASSGYYGATGAQSIVATNAATFYVTGVKLEIGSVATPFNRQSLAKSMADCQRYYQKIGSATVAASIGIQGYASAGGSNYAYSLGYQAMRASPTANSIGSFTNTNAGVISFYAGPQAMLIQATPPVVGAFSWYNADATAFITLSAEL